MTSVTSEQFERDSEADDETFIDETLKCKYLYFRTYSDLQSFDVSFVY